VYLEGNGNRRNVVPIPQRFKHAIGKAHRHQILYHFLAQVMIDAEEPNMGENNNNKKHENEKKKKNTQ
jgi:hypothetical protein